MHGSNSHLLTGKADRRFFVEAKGIILNSEQLFKQTESLWNQGLSKIPG